MWSPEGEKAVAKDEAEHKALAKKGYSHDKPEVDEVAEPVAKGEKDFKAKHKVKKSGEKEDGTVVKENREWAKLDDSKKESKKEYYQKLSKLRRRLMDAQDEADDDGDEDKVDAIMSKLEKVDQEQKDLVAKFGRGVVNKSSSASESYKKDEKEDENEGNEFTMALAQARKNGDKDFVVSGKKYMVKDQKDDDDKEEVDEGTLPPALQKAIDKKKGKKTDDVEESADKEDEEEVEEAANKGLVKKAVALALKMSGNMTGATKKIEKMQKGLSKDKEVSAALQLANEERIAEADDKKAKYKAFFDKALNKFGVDSPAELKGDKKKEFFDYVDKNYNSEDEPGKDGAK
jgi:hypothetical protein